MTKPSNTSRTGMDTSARVYGARYRDTADASLAALAEAMSAALTDARDAGTLPACRFRVTVLDGAPLSDSLAVALRVCVELHDLAAAKVTSDLWSPDAMQAFLCRDVHATLDPFGWRNPDHPLFDRRFRTGVHLVGIHAPVTVCHLCGNPHPLSPEGATDARTAHGSGD